MRSKLASALGLTLLAACTVPSRGEGTGSSSQQAVADTLRGMNVDPAFGNGPGTTAYASAEQLQCVGITRVRFVLKVVPNVTGSSLEEALGFYENVVSYYRAASIDVVVILNSETVSGWTGPGPLPSGYVGSFASAATEIAGRYRGRVHAYEIWNEEDDPATYVTPTDYLALFDAAHDAIQGADGSATIVMGGMDSGDPAGYLAQMGGSLPGDAVVALHPYVHWPASDPGEDPGWSTYEDLVRAMRNQTSAPLWFTEWGDDQDGRNAKLVAAMFGDGALAGMIDESYYFSWHDAQKPGHSFGVVKTTSRGDEFKADMVDAFRHAAGLSGPHPACGGSTDADAGGGGGADAGGGGHSRDGGCD